MAAPLPGRVKKKKIWRDERWRWVAGWMAWRPSNAMFHSPRWVIHTSFITGNRQDIQAFITSIHHHHFINLKSCEPALQPVPKHLSKRAAGQRFTPTASPALTQTHTKQEKWASVSTSETHTWTQSESERKEGGGKAILHGVKLFPRGLLSDSLSCIVKATYTPATSHHLLLLTTVSQRRIMMDILNCRRIH